MWLNPVWVRFADFDNVMNFTDFENVLELTNFENAMNFTNFENDGQVGVVCDVIVHVTKMMTSSVVLGNWK